MEQDQLFQELAKQKRPNLIVEFYCLLKQNKKWWLAPILLVLLLLGVLVFLSSTPLAPFIYSIF